METLKIFEYKGLNIPYYEKTIKINNIDFRKYYIIDIRNMEQDTILKLFDDAKNFCYSLLLDEYTIGQRDKLHPINFMLYFLIDKNKDYGIDKEKIKYDFMYAFKDFISYDDFLKIINSKNWIIPEISSIYSYRGEQIDINTFNLIYGYNASGKTQLLKFIAEQKNSPIFSIYRDLNNEKNFLYEWEEQISNLNQVIDYCDNKNIPILLDDFPGHLDIRNQITVIDQLYEYSQNNKVILSSCKDQTLSLVKKRTHNPNIINLNNMQLY